MQSCSCPEPRTPNPARAFPPTARILGTSARRAAVLLALLAGARSAGASPASPRQPSLQAWASLNQAVLPESESDWEFEIAHIDMAIAGAHKAGFDARGAAVYQIGYWLLTTTLDPAGEGEHLALREFCAARGIDPEDAYLHFADDTVVRLYEGDLFVPAWSAADPAASRARSPGAGYGPRYLFHAASPCLQEWVAERIRTDLHPPSGAGRDGAFFDEMNPHFIEHFARAGAYDGIASGGHIREFDGAAWNSREATARFVDGVAAALRAIDERLGADPEVHREPAPAGHHLLLVNVGDYFDGWIPELTRWAEAGDGLLTEFLIREGAVNLAPLAWDVMRDLGEAGKVFVAAQGAFAPPAGLSPGLYASTEDRHVMFCLAFYWLGRYPGSTYYSLSYHDGYTTVRERWVAAQERDLGAPDGEYFEWSAGTDGNGKPYVIYGRRYGRALVLLRPTARSDWDYVGRFGDDTVSPPHALDAAYRILGPDGTLGDARREIALRNAEAAVLVPDDLPPPDAGTDAAAEAGADADGDDAPHVDDEDAAGDAGIREVDDTAADGAPDAAQDAPSAVDDGAGDRVDPRTDVHESDAGLDDGCTCRASLRPAPCGALAAAALVLAAARARPGRRSAARGSGIGDRGSGTGVREPNPENRTPSILADRTKPVEEYRGAAAAHAGIATPSKHAHNANPDKATWPWTHRFLLSVLPVIRLSCPPLIGRAWGIRLHFGFGRVAGQAEQPAVAAGRGLYRSRVISKRNRWRRTESPPRGGLSAKFMVRNLESTASTRPAERKLSPADSTSTVTEPLAEMWTRYTASPTSPGWAATADR
jgi:hypothetical protein